MELRQLIVAMLVVAMSLALLGATTLAADSDDGDKDLVPVRDFVLESMKTLEGNQLAVLPFGYLDNSFSIEGRLLADLVHMQLASSGKVEMLEREKLATIMQEHKMGKMGLIDAATAPKLGHLTGVNAFVFGHTVDLGHKLQITIRVVDVNSKILAQKNFLLNKRIKTPTTPLWEDIQKIKQKNKEQFKIEVWTDKTEYNIGDELVIKFKADRSCYVTLFNMGSSGQITVLFPNRFYATNYVKKCEEYAIPGRFQNFKIKARGPAGIEKLKIFATDNKVPLLPEQYNVSAFRSIDPKTEASVTRDLAITLTNLDNTAWAEASFEFQVRNLKEVPGQRTEPHSESLNTLP